MLQISRNGVSKTQSVIIILLLVSFVLPSWYLSGTIDQLVSLSLYVITPEHFYLLSFIIAMLFSMTLGTSVGTLSAVGIPIISTALAIELPLEIVAGALISGAFVGDRTSPFSSAFQLLSHTVETPTKKQFKAMSVTTVIGVTIAILFYGILDSKSTFTITQVTPGLKEISLLSFLPPLILIAVVLFRKGIIYGFLLSIVAASMLALTNDVTTQELFSSLLLGVEGKGGGLINMYLLLLFLALAGAYNGILEEFKLIQPLIDQWFDTSKNIVDDTIKTILATFGISLIAANQTLPIILTGRTLLTRWRKNHTQEELSRVMGDSTMLFPAMIPWSVLALMCSAVVGVPIISYLPYAIFIWSLPIFTIVVSFVKLLKNNKHNQDIANAS
ncbi:Na+/H+ antiporter NhaC family protein [Fredinandcohnia sp. 179-A 10B2 NHS]|uniref:Na+/H+ antiporter NhaC family protein n=1 Tax=Fredinandcohnia sp. 179-A 10B2 NHS TaxID=3235176 RepID=UPI0039A0AE0B